MVEASLGTGQDRKAALACWRWPHLHLEVKVSPTIYEVFPHCHVLETGCEAGSAAFEASVLVNTDTTE